MALSEKAKLQIHFLPEKISERLRESRVAAFHAQTPAYRAFLEELKICPRCKGEAGKQRETHSWRGSLVTLEDPMCDGHFEMYNHFRKTGHCPAPWGEYDLI